MVIPLVPLIVTLSVELPTVMTLSAIVIWSELFSLIVIPLSLIVTLSVDEPITLVAANTALCVVPSLTVIPAELIEMCSLDLSPILVIAPNDATSVLLSKTLKLSCVNTTLSLLLALLLIVIVPPVITVSEPKEPTSVPP